MQTLTIEESALTLKAGKVIAYPTEGVWGLGCDPFYEQAVMKLLALKNRAVDKGLILLAANTEQLLPFTTLDNASIHRLQQESTTTFLVPFNHDTVPRWITGQHDLLAVRVSGHPTVKALCETFNQVIVSTSANTSGLPAARSRDEVAHYFPRLPICQGAIGCDKKPSRIIHFQTGDVIRG